MRHAGSWRVVVCSAVVLAAACDDAPEAADSDIGAVFDLGTAHDAVVGADVGDGDPGVDADAADEPDAEEPLLPLIEAGEPRTLPVPTAVDLPPVVGFTVNARVHPRGLPATWHVEYGATTAYGSATAPRPLPGRLAAYFAEDWAGGLNGWQAGFSGVQLVGNTNGGPGGGPFVRYTDDQGAGDDVNHYDGIGVIHLGPYAYIGNYYWADVPPMYLGGGFPDLRGARISAWLRGVDWVANGTEIGTWIQGYRDRTVVEVLPQDSRYPNYAFTGDPLTHHLASGEWENADWVLRNRTADFTFAGAYGGRLLYDYGELDALLSGVNVDFFLLQILYVDLANEPIGSFDVAQMQMVYRQHSLCADSNGGSLVASSGGSGVEYLADGWRNGIGREWVSDEDPVAPQVFEYAFERPVEIYSVNVGNSIEFPSRDIEIALSEDGGESWIAVGTATMPESHELGPNYLFAHLDRWVLENEIAVWAPLHDRTVNRMRVAVTSGYGERWGLGEIEAFGTGAAEETDDDWYDLNHDVLVEPGTWHYRIVAESREGTAVGPDQVVAVP